MQNREIEVKFLEINKEELIAKLRSFGATDIGERKESDWIYYDSAGEWRDSGKEFIRVRQGRKITMAYKKEEEDTVTGVKEIEFEISDTQKARDFLEATGFQLARAQEKIRHTFKFDDVTVDIDSWPRIPTYVELEGPSEESIKKAAGRLGFEWRRGIFGTAQNAIEKNYKIPVRKLRYFTFDKVE